MNSFANSEEIIYSKYENFTGIAMWTALGCKVSRGVLLHFLGFFSYLLQHPTGVIDNHSNGDNSVHFWIIFAQKGIKCCTRLYMLKDADPLMPTSNSV